MTNLLNHSLGRYQILEQLGQGGMATVYKAYDTRLERDVAVKVLRTELFGQAVLERLQKRFEREARALGKLTHPHIVRVLDYGEHEGSPYLVLEYIPGGTLKQRLGKPIPWQEAARILLPIAAALQVAHEQGIVHRDVKPSNILITASGKPMLTDFGIAKVLDSEETQTLTGTGVGIGTPEYMSPEQGLGREIDARADIYSLGIVLYELITGHKPYTADTPMAVVMKHITEPLPRPQRFVPDLPEIVEKVLIKALAKDPQNRYPTMKAFAADLERLCHMESKGWLKDDASTIFQEVDTQETVIQESDSQSTIDQMAVSSLHPSPSSPLSPSPSAGIPKKETKTKERWLLPLGIGIGVFALFCVAIIGLVLILPTNLLNQNQPPLNQPTNPITFNQNSITEPPATVNAPPAAQTPEPAPAAIQPAPTNTTAPTLPPPPSPTPTPPQPFGKIVYTCQVSRLTDINEICIMNADGSHFRQLTNYGANSAYASLSPDGQSVVFASNAGGDWQIYEMNLNSGYTRQLTFGPGEANAPEISPDGNFIVYKYSDLINGLDSIWVMNRDGSNAHQVYINAWDPVWSPDGRQILFASGSVSNPQLYIANANGSGARQITNLDNLRGRSDWSILGLIATYAGIRPNRNIYTLNTDGSNVAQITNGGDNLAPSFSPDGNWITFMSYRDHPGDSNGCEIYVMRVDGSNVRRLTNNDYCDWQPRWGP